MRTDPQVTMVTRCNFLLTTTSLPSTPGNFVEKDSPEVWPSTPAGAGWILWKPLKCKCVS